jgi:hypothetical protein
MPKTFQVSALSNKDWDLSSEWARWMFTPTDLPPPASSSAVAPLQGEVK